MQCTVLARYGMVKDPAAQRIRPTPNPSESQPGNRPTSLAITRSAVPCGMKLLGETGKWTDERGTSPPSALPGISPSRGEIDMRLGFGHLNVEDEVAKGPLVDLPP